MKEIIAAPELIRERIWIELRRAAQDRHHEWRTPVLATVGPDGKVDARTVVLRSADPELACLRFFTDSRSGKITQLAAQPQCALVFWSTRLNWQLRLRADIAIQTNGPEVDSVWERVRQSAAAGDYLSAASPGQKLVANNIVQPPTLQQHHLAIVSLHVQEIDWLELSRSGHRRAKISESAFEWLVP